MSRKSSLRYPAMMGVALGLGVGLSIGAALFVGQWQASRRQAQFQQQIENLTTALQRSLNRYTDVLTFLHDYYRVVEQPVSRQEFEDFVARSLATYPGIQALEWAPLVRREDRLAFEQAVQAEGYPDFELTELGPDNRLRRAAVRAEHLPVTYVAPLLNNEAALGYDLGSDIARASAIDPARTSGSTQATARIRLVQEQRDQFGFLVVRPLYAGGEVPTDAAARQAQFEGVLVGVFRVADVVEEALQSLNANIDFALYDQNASAEQQFLGQYDAAIATVLAAVEPPLQPSTLACPRPADCTRPLTLGQRQWQVVFAPAAAYGISRGYGAPLTLLTGLLLTGSLALFLHNLHTELSRTQALGEMKLKFFSMASHELRTPLSTILLSAESLRGDVTLLSGGQPGASQAKTKLERILMTAQHMSQQITDLLTLTRAEAGKLEFNPTLLDAVAFCQQMIDEVQMGISQSITFSRPDLPITAFWDQRLGRSLLINLLMNAANYSAADQPIAVVLDSDGQRATLTVRDRGRGIPATDLATIREAFQRGSNVGDRPGSGLGLAIVNTAVTLHRGTWHLESTQGDGTAVTVQLPLE
jgi:signal transduction histidine kinase